MAGFNSVFQRKEKKYHLNATQDCMMLRALMEYMEIDEYGETVISSIYYDTPEWHLIDRSLEKPTYKEKLRVRCYGPMQPHATAFVEIKKKFKGIVYKRRIAMSLAGAQAYLSGMPYEQACMQYPMSDLALQELAFSYRERQIAREIDAFMLRYAPLAPHMEIRVLRSAYRMKSPVQNDGSSPVEALQDETAALAGQGDLRVTFDRHCRYCNLSAAHAAEQALIGSGEAVMEIKSTGPYPLWLVEALDHAQAYPESFSKYGRAYLACAAGGVKTGDAVCMRTSRASYASAACSADRAQPTRRVRSTRSAHPTRTAQPADSVSPEEAKIHLRKKEKISA